MTGKRVVCPKCYAVLYLPDECTSRVVRCGKCHHRIRLVRPAPVTEALVASWLMEPTPAL